jgi:hypothetical protein
VTETLVSRETAALAINQRDGNSGISFEPDHHFGSKDRADATVGRVIEPAREA